MHTKFFRTKKALSQDNSLVFKHLYDPNQVHILEKIIDDIYNKCTPNIPDNLFNSICTLAAGEGYLSVLEWCHENGYPWNSMTCARAAENGHLNCLEYAHKNNCPVDLWVSFNAAGGGHLSCLKYLHNHGCDWNEYTCQNAAKYGHFDCLRYAHENGCKWNEKTCEKSAESGSIACLQYAHENNCPWNVLTMYAAAKFGRLECLIYCHKNNCEWNDEVCYYASANGHYSCVVYLCENDCPITYTRSINVAKNDKIKKYIEKKLNGTRLKYHNYDKLYYTHMNDQTILLQGPQGTRDFYPEEMAKRNWLFQQWSNVSKEFGYRQYDGPVLELASLYTRKGGDDVLNEMYAFTDREGTNVCLRPEMTPTVARMIMKLGNSELYPIRWFSIPQCWRFETTTRGRKREHYQWNVDIFGADKVKSEVEILTIIVAFFKKIGITPNDVTLKVSNRMIIQKVIEKMNVNPDMYERAFNIIDKIKKVTKEELYEMLTSELNITTENADTIYELTQVSDLSDLDKFLGKDDETTQEMLAIFNLAEVSGIKEWLTFDVSIMRGLSYYTGFVFEGFYKNTTLQRSICGGGRYDNLLQKYGNKEQVPVVGFGFGDVVTLEVLEELNKIPDLTSQLDYYVISYNNDLYNKALEVSAKLRAKGFSVMTHMKSDGKLRQAFGHADRQGAKYAVLIAPTEYANGQMVIKNLRSKEKDTTVGIDDFISNL
jgi:histidyl-tRNA synthetase